MIIFNGLGLAMVLIIGGIVFGLESLLGDIPAGWDWPVFGGVLIVVDGAVRWWRSSRLAGEGRRDLWLVAMDESVGGSFFYLPVWVWAVLFIILGSMAFEPWVMLTTGLVFVLNLAVRLRYAWRFGVGIWTALFTPRHGTILFLIPVWLVALGVFSFMLWVFWSFS